MFVGGGAKFDAGMAQAIPIRERFHLRFEATFTNVLNHTASIMPGPSKMPNPQFPA